MPTPTKLAFSSRLVFNLRRLFGFTGREAAAVGLTVTASSIEALHADLIHLTVVEALSVNSYLNCLPLVVAFRQTRPWAPEELKAAIVYHLGG